MTPLDKRIKGLIDSCRDAVFITMDDKGIPVPRIMNKIQDNERSGGVFWFATTLDSEKVKRINNNSKVSLMFYDPKSCDCANVYGSAQIITDTEAKERFWNDDWKQYFPGGASDPVYCLIKVIPEKGDFFFNAENKSGVISYLEKQA